MSYLDMSSHADFEIRSYGFQELGTKYFPFIQPKSASQQLKRWILRSEKLLADLVQTGYHNGQRTLTPRQVRLIVTHLDPP